MKTVSDVIVVGGGPCGSFTALNLAKHGANVTVLEEHEEIGVPSHCAGHLSIEGLKRLGLFPLPSGIVENLFCGATFHSPNGKAFPVRFSSLVTCTVNRSFFDKHLALLAEKAGADYQLGSRVESLVIKDGFVKGVIVNRDGDIEEYVAKIIVDAEGISSRLLRQTGLSVLDRRWLVNGVEAEVENVRNVQSDNVEVFLGNDFAPGFYGWLIPKGDGEAKVGLGTRTGNPKELLQRLMSEHPTASKKLNKAIIKHMAFHPISLGGPIKDASSNGFLVIGDAASHVKSTTGGGIILGLTCSALAAEAALEALQKEDCSSTRLGSYDKSCRKALGFDAKIMFRMRKMLDALSDAQIEGVIDFCGRYGLDKVLLSVKDLDFQGRPILRILRNPRVLMALSYLFRVYLSANP